ncbi:MAG TPA: MFS transporter [Thermoanaerobaculia bacterium]|nr:MFS transporter [Thermoanaerobaculia bacterium]
MSDALSRRRALIPVFVTVLLDLIGFGMIIPQLPFYAQSFHATPAQVGWLFASYSLMQLFFAPPLGRLSDRVGRRPVLLVSIAGSVASYLLFAFAPSFGWLLLSRALAGIAAGNYGIAQAYVADVTPPEERSKAMGMVVGAAFGLGFVLGPALGAILAQFGPLVLPLTGAALGAVNLAFALLWLAESLPPEARGQVRGTWFEPRLLADSWRNPPVRGLMLLAFLVTFCFSMMETTLALYCQDRFGFDMKKTGWLFVYVGVLLVLVQGALVGRLVKRFGERQLILASILVMAAGLALLPLATLPWLLLPALTLLAFGSGVHNPSSLGLLSLLTDAGEQGGVSGIYRSYGALARTLGPLAGPWMFQAVSIRSPFWAAGGLMLITFLIGWDLLRRMTVG